MDRMTRCLANPILSPQRLMPSKPGFRVLGVFNCGAVRYRDEILLLCRVAETADEIGAESLRVPVLGESSGYRDIIVEEFSRDNERFDFSDSRVVRCRKTDSVAGLTSLSHFRLARSRDGVNFKIDAEAWIDPQGSSEEWGIEDPRIIPLAAESGVEYQIIYSAISRDGVAVSRISTTDFCSFSRRGTLLPPTNKDAVIFPEKIEGRYWLLHRPVPSGIGGLHIWTAQSGDLVHWGNHELLYKSGEPGSWEEERVGVGPPPIATDKGWLVFYHGADAEDRYSVGMLLLDRKHPAKILARTREPVFVPREKYETTGFFPNVVFPCGIIDTNDGLRLYYGAADEYVCTAVISWKTVWEALDA